VPPRRSTAAGAAGAAGDAWLCAARGAVEAPQPKVPHPATSTESSESSSEARRLCLIVAIASVAMGDDVAARADYAIAFVRLRREGFVGTSEVW
jgi:hypothetical protein